MEIGIFVLGLILALGIFSLYRNNKKNTLIQGVIQDFMDTNNSLLIKIETPSDSGPFKDEFYDQKSSEMYQNLGYSANETIYRQVSFQTADGANKQAWLQLRIEAMKATYIEWKE